MKEETDFLTLLKNDTMDFIMAVGVKLIYVGIAIIVGIIVIRLLLKLLRKILEKSKTELSLRIFILSLSRFTLYAALCIIVGIIFGIKASAFVTAIGAAGIAIGLALQGSLSNFAGGVLILIFKPFRVEDKVVINGVFGVVDEVNILYTRIRTWNGKLITMPNGKVSNSDIENRTILIERRVEIDLWFSFDEDVDRLREIVTRAMSKHADLIEGKPLQLWLQEFHDSSMRMSARCWVKTDIYWEVYWDQIEAIKKALEVNHVKFALPKREIYYPADKQEREMQAK